MVDILNWLFGQYADYPALFISLELVAVICGVISVLLASRLNVLVFPVGIYHFRIKIIWK